MAQRVQVHGPGCIRCTLSPPRVQAKQSRCTKVRNSRYAILGRHAGADLARIPQLPGRIISRECRCTGSLDVTLRCSLPVIVPLPLTA